MRVEKRVDVAVSGRLAGVSNQAQELEQLDLLTSFTETACG